MAIARRRRFSVDPIAPPVPRGPDARTPLPELPLPVPLGDAPAPDTVTPVGRLRRCTFRRIDRVNALPGRGGESAYETVCLYYGTADEPLALGDISQARPVCEACRATGIFRPDED